MKLYLIRHAESANNLLVRQQGMDDTPGHEQDPVITDTGHKQCALLAEHIATPGAEPRAHPSETNPDPSYRFTHLYCSLMTRSLETAEYIHLNGDIELQALPDIFERKGLYGVDQDGQCHGVQGPAKDYFESRFPEVSLPRELGGQGWWNRPVETDEQFLDRVASSLDNVIQRHNNETDRVAMVVHGDYIDQCINHMMGTPRHPHNYRSPWVANWVFHNTSISRIDVHDDFRNVVYLNRIDHLPGPLVSY